MRGPTDEIRSCEDDSRFSFFFFFFFYLFLYFLVSSWPRCPAPSDRWTFCKFFWVILTQRSSKGRIYRPDKYLWQLCGWICERRVLGTSTIPLWIPRCSYVSKHAVLRCLLFSTFAKNPKGSREAEDCGSRLYENLWSRLSEMLDLNLADEYIYVHIEIYWSFGTSGMPNFKMSGLNFGS